MSKNKFSGFCAISKDGIYRKFNSRAEVCKILGIDKSNLSACLKGKAKSAKGYIFMTAEELESVNKDNEIAVDTEKIWEKLKPLVTIKPEIREYKEAA